MSISFNKMPLITCVQTRSTSALSRSLRGNGFQIFKLDGKSVSDAESFFSEVIRKLPLDPRLSGSVNWDALSDSLWNGFDELGSSKVAILWTDTGKMVERRLAEFLTAILCFRQVASSLADPKSGVSVPVKLLLFLIGDGASFQPFDEK